MTALSHIEWQPKTVRSPSDHSSVSSESRCHCVVHKRGFLLHPPAAEQLRQLKRGPTQARIQSSVRTVATMVCARRTAAAPWLERRTTPEPRWWPLRVVKSNDTAVGLNRLKAALHRSEDVGVEGETGVDSRVRVGGNRPQSGRAGRCTYWTRTTKSRVRVNALSYVCARYYDGSPGKTGMVGLTSRCILGIMQSAARPGMFLRVTLAVGTCPSVPSAPMPALYNKRG